MINVEVELNFISALKILMEKHGIVAIKMGEQGGLYIDETSNNVVIDDVYVIKKEVTNYDLYRQT